MAKYFKRLPDLVIANGATSSNAIPYDSVFEDCDALVIITPAALDAIAFNVMVSVDNGATFAKHCPSTGTPTNLSVASQAYHFERGLMPLGQFKITSASNVAAARTFQVLGQFETL